MASRALVCALLAALLLASALTSPLKLAAGSSKRSALCQICVQQAVAVVNLLLNAIIGKEIQTCNQLCGYLSNPTEREVCDGMCDAVGLAAFIDWLKGEDIDFIYMCEKLDMCPIDDCTGDCIDLSNYAVKPAKAPVGATLHHVALVHIMQAWNGTGMLRVTITFPGGDTTTFDNLLSGDIGPVGTEQLDISMSTKSSGNTNFEPGTYASVIEICNGECGSSYPHSRIFASAKASFTLTEQTPRMENQIDA